MKSPSRIGRTKSMQVAKRASITNIYSFAFPRFCILSEVDYVQADSAKLKSPNNVPYVF